MYERDEFKSMEAVKLMKRSRKKGQTAIEYVILLIVLGIIGLVVFSFISKHVWGNKQIVDFNHQRFTAAYVLGNSNIWTKVQVKAWKDWENSDSVQIVTPDGKAIYTHLANVKLVQE